MQVRQWRRHDQKARTNGERKREEEREQVAAEHLRRAVPKGVDLPRHAGRGVEFAQQERVATGGLVDHADEVRGGLVMLHPAAVDKLELAAVHEAPHLCTLVGDGEGCCTTECACFAV